MDYPSPCAVYFIRRGETGWNRDGRWQGHLDVPLSAEGRAPGAPGRGGDRLRFPVFERSEPGLGDGGSHRRRDRLRPVAVAALREIGLGVWAGRTRDEIAHAFPEEWLRMQRNEDIPRGGGKTFAAFQRSILEWLNRAAEDRECRTICVVTHGGCIRAVLLLALGLTWAERDRVPPIENGSITVVERTAGVWKAVRINDAQGIRKSRAEENRIERNEGDPA